ncbi:alpha/beta fold hydrolase [Bacillus cereus group sp. BfR-BA-01380]|uniref:alpha/beta fold hydrolase n=1 Tax=Bacillus cereus group sp. BfR-BA-01380 TaxID=2920324 RepID=UPI001F56C95F|nr:alpha/beta hydrolase [Bacillus cereus group sp. BfR-BA-01380]
MQTKKDFKKKTIIFIHGLVGNRRAFKKECKLFSSSYNIITYDLLGHGDDKGQAIDFSLNQLVGQLSDLYEKEGIQQAHICALSYGCYIATIFAHKYPEKVLSLCHIGGHYNNPSILFNVFQKFWEKRNNEYSSWLYQYASTIFPSGILKANPFAIVSKNIYYRFGLQLHSSIIRESLRHRLEFDLKSRLRELTQPILWVMGEHDHLYKSCLFDLKSILPNVSYKEIPLAGHAANIFRPNYFYDLYSQFLRDTSS